MANEIRTRANFKSGTIVGTISAGATTFVSDKLTGLAAISATEHAVLVFNPTGTSPEIVYVSAHTASSSTATIIRGREGSTATEQGNGATWIHVPTAYDYVGTVANTSTLPSTGGLPYEGQIVYQLDVNSIKVFSDSAWCEIGPVSQWAAWAPTMTQNTSVSYTNSYGRYMRVGRLIVAQCRLAVTGSGSSGSRIYLSLPVNRAYTSAEQVLGEFRYNVPGTGSVLRGNVFGTSGAQTISFQHMASGNFIGDGEVFGAASGDIFTVSVMYEAAS